jgi:hypothetical protein
VLARPVVPENPITVAATGGREPIWVVLPDDDALTTPAGER